MSSERSGVSRAIRFPLLVDDGVAVAEGVLEAIEFVFIDL
jgi:hypothetical protein